MNIYIYLFIYNVLGSDVDNGGDCIRGDRIYGKSLYILLNFVLNLKLLEKVKVLVKKLNA